MPFKYGQKLPKEKTVALDAFMKRAKEAKYFQPSNDLKKYDVEKQVNFTLECFGVKAGIEYRSLKTELDWSKALATSCCQNNDLSWARAIDAAQDAALESGKHFDTSKNIVWEAAQDIARIAERHANKIANPNAKNSSVWYSACGVARYTAWYIGRGAVEILSTGLTDFDSKFPKGAFVPMFALWEMGVYPVGVVDGNFVVYIPTVKNEFPKDFEF